MTTEMLAKADSSTFYIPKKRTLWQKIWKEKVAYILLLPAFISYFVFFAYPVIFAFVASFTNYDAFTMRALPNIFDNYNRAIIRDPVTKKALINVVEYVILTLFFGQALSLILAMALNGLRKGVAFFRTVYYIPMVTSVVTVATIFKWLFGGDASSPINLIIKTLFDLSPIRWFYEPTIVIPLIAMIAIWLGIGFNTIIWMAGLKAIPIEYYEVATIDGANGRQKFWSITLPLLKPVLIFQVVMGFIGGMKEFGLPLVLTQGGPSYASTTPVYMVYNYGFLNLQMGYASALAYLLTVILIAATVIQFRLFGKTESYE
jgi:multiple sugar transport system permease protein